MTHLSQWHGIPKSSIEQQDILPVANFMGQAKLLRNKVTFTVSGYNDDPRGLASIPSFRMWSKQLSRKIPYWTHMASHEGDGGIIFQYFVSLSYVRTVWRANDTESVKIDNKKLAKAYLDSLIQTEEQANLFGIAIADVNKHNQAYASWLSRVLRVQLYKITPIIEFLHENNRRVVFPDDIIT